MATLHAPHSASPGRPQSAEGSRRSTPMRYLGLHTRRSAESGILGSGQLLQGQLTLELLSARGLWATTPAAAASPHHHGAASANTSTTSITITPAPAPATATGGLASSNNSSSSSPAPAAAAAAAAAAAGSSSHSSGSLVVAVVRALPEARPKKQRSEPRRYEAAEGLVVWNQKLQLTLRRADLLSITLQSHGHHNLHVEVPLLGLQLQRAVPVTLDVPVRPQGELRMVLTFEDATPLFGMDVAAVCAREQEDVPSIVRKCCEAVEDFGLTHKGIYRVPGNKPKVDQLIQAFTEDAKGVQFTAKDVLSINNIASLLKSYLQALPEPVMTHKARPLFLEAVAMEEGPAKVARFADLLLSLPTASRSTSLFLLAHMLKITTATESNQMDASNLAVCFGPTMLGSDQNEELTGANTSSASIELTQSLKKPRPENEVIKYLLMHPEVISTCLRGLRSHSMQSANTSMTDLSDATTMSYQDDLDASQRVLFRFQSFDSAKSGQLTRRDFRMLCFDLGRLLCPREEAVLFDRLCGREIGISWPSFRAWWDATERAPLSQDARESLANVVAFFKMHVPADERFATREAMEAIRDEIVAANPQIDAEDLPLPVTTKTRDGLTSVKEYVRWLLQHDLI